MKVSTKGRYALRLMVDLGVNGGEDKYISLKDISARQNISIKYLEQIVTPLHRAGLVRSVRGAQGGYRLSRKADKYTAGEILRAIEGSFAPIACLETPENECERYTVYIIRNHFVHSFPKSYCSTIMISFTFIFLCFLAGKIGEMFVW